jgi:hypothetical protein
MKNLQNTSKTPALRIRQHIQAPNNRRLALILSLLLFLAGCTGTPCADIPSNFATYDEAITAVESASFSISESVNTSKSSFINDADFYSCNGHDGFLILQFNENDYIFEGVPMAVWEGFKDAESFGEFYDRNIRGRYRYHSN